MVVILATDEDEVLLFYTRPPIDNNLCYIRMHNIQKLVHGTKAAMPYSWDTNLVKMQNL